MVQEHKKKTILIGLRKAHKHHKHLGKEHGECWYVVCTFKYYKI
jgi:hypothetical protein